MKPNNRKYIIFTKHAKMRLFQRLIKNHINMSMYHAMRRVGRLAARILPDLTKRIKRFTLDWEFGKIRMVLADDPYSYENRYILTVIF
jgi:hypothetical protein